MNNQEQLENKKLIDELKNIKIDEPKKEFDENYVYWNPNLNILSIYLNEMAQYPLLTVEEEEELGHKLKIVNELLIVEPNSKKIDLNSLFSSLINNSSHKIIINSLLNYYAKNKRQTDLDIFTKLQKYNILSQKYNRPLYDYELKKYFEIDVNSSKKFSEKDLLIQTKKYIEYNNAYDKMFNSNLRLVVKIAKPYQGQFELLDLINEGNLGLMKAIEKFDVSLGYKFSTYATFWIKQNIKRYMNGQRYPIKIPEYMINILLKFKRDVHKLEHKMEKKLSPYEIAEQLSMPLETVLEYLKYNEEIVSLDQPLTTTSEFTIKDTIETEDNTEKEVFSKILSEDVDTFLDELTEKEREIIHLRYGFNKEGKQKTLQEIGDMFGLSRERVRQLEAKALNKMRVLAKIKTKYRTIGDHLK